MFTEGCVCLQETVCVYRGLCVFSLQEAVRVYMGLCVFTGGCACLHEAVRVYRRLCAFTGGCVCACTLFQQGVVVYSGGHHLLSHYCVSGRKPSG